MVEWYRWGFQYSFGDALDIMYERRDVWLYFQYSFGDAPQRV